MVRGTGVGKKMKQKADKKDDKAMVPEREYGRRSTTPRSAARRSTAAAPSAKRTTAMPSPGRKPASAAKRPVAASRKGANAKKRSGK
jgi:hypothetical protein